MTCVQHPDLIEKRRKVFADRISQYIKPKAQDHSELNGSGKFGADQAGPRQRPVTRHTS